MENPRNKLLLQLTGQELIDLLSEGLALSQLDYEVPKEVRKHFVYGLAGLEQLLGVSRATAQRIKNSGVIDPATSQVGRILVFDADLVIDLLKVKKTVRHRHK